jgi:hypothetical protein
MRSIALFGSRNPKIRTGLTGAWKQAGLTACLGLAGLSLAGCGQVLSPSTYQVDGQVVLANGQPLKGGKITFVPNSSEGTVLPASGSIGADGKFSLTTKKDGDGATAGDYRVRIEPPADLVGKNAPKPGFPTKYADVDSSGIEVTIRPEPNRLEPFRLK